MARNAAHVTMLQRSPSYIGSLPEKNPVAEVLRKVLPERWSAPLIRWTLALGTQAFYQVSPRYPGPVKKVLRQGVQRQLPPGYDVDPHFSPSYNPCAPPFFPVPAGHRFQPHNFGPPPAVTSPAPPFPEP